MILLLVIILVSYRNQAVKIDKTDNKSINVFEASKSGDLTFIKNLIDQGYYINTFNKDGDTALITPSHNGHIEVVKYLESIK